MTIRQHIIPDTFDSWDSLEGLSRPVPVAARAPAPTNLADAIRQGGQRGLTWVGERVAGFMLAAALAYFADSAAEGVGRMLGLSRSPVSGIPIAIVLGVILCNAVGIPELFQQGLQACLRPLQRLAIVLLGWRLSLSVVGEVGIRSLPVVVVTISAALVIVPWVGARMAIKRRLATLIAVGTSICGVSAIMAMAPVIEADEDEISYAVACIAIFGMLAMLFYPLLVPLILGDNRAAIGIFFGTAIHDTAQVTGAALAYQQAHHAPEVLNTATVVKILRNLSMVAVIPIMAGLFRRQQPAGHSSGKAGTPIIPLFVLGFLGMTLLRTMGDAWLRPILSSGGTGRWEDFLALMDHSSTWMLTVVMAAVGLGTRLRSLMRLGLRPFVVGLFAAVAVGGIGLGMSQLVAGLAGR